MTLQLFGHPFSSYTQKALIALYENGTPFEFRMLGPEEPANGAEFARLWPIKRFPILVDEPSRESIQKGKLRSRSNGNGSKTITGVTFLSFP